MQYNINLDNYVPLYSGAGKSNKVTRKVWRKKDTKWVKKKAVHPKKSKLMSLMDFMDYIQITVPDCSSILNIDPDTLFSDEIPPLLSKINEKCEELDDFIVNTCGPLANAALDEKRNDKYNYYDGKADEAKALCQKLLDFRDKLYDKYEWYHLQYTDIPSIDEIYGYNLDRMTPVEAIRAKEDAESILISYDLTKRVLNHYMEQAQNDEYIHNYRIYRRQLKEVESKENKVNAFIQLLNNIIEPGYYGVGSVQVLNNAKEVLYGSGKTTKEKRRRIPFLESRVLPFQEIIIPDCSDLLTIDVDTLDPIEASELRLEVMGRYNELFSMSKLLRKLRIMALESAQFADNRYYSEKYLEIDAIIVKIGALLKILDYIIDPVHLGKDLDYYNRQKSKLYK